MEDHEAVTRLKSGDIAGLESLVRTHYLTAVRAAYLVVREREAAEDIVQAAFLRAYERIGQFDSARPFAPWFLRGVINDAVKAATRRGRQRSLDEPPGSGAIALSDLLIDPAPGPEDAAEHAERRRQVWAALGSLPAKQRAAVVLRYYVGLSEAEVAEHLRCTPGAAKWRLHAARTRLRALLEPWWHAARGTVPGKASAD
jgi:RNA polymerase sigma-70 factor (ECF subfamily)